MKIDVKINHLVALIALSVLFVPLTLRADSYSDIAELSDEVEEVADELSEEFEDHYEDSRNYPALENYVDTIESKSSRIHRHARSRSVSMSALQREVADLDQVIHALHALVDQMEKDAGKYALRMFGNTRRVHALLGTLENKTHSMQNRSQNTGQGQSYYGGNQGSSSSRYGYPASGSSSRHTYPNQPSHKYPSNGSRSQNERANDHDDDHDDRSGGGNIFQRIHRKHLRVRDAILGRD